MSKSSNQARKLRQREARRQSTKEPPLETTNAFGHKDFTPFLAIEHIRDKERRALKRELSLKLADD